MSATRLDTSADLPNLQSPHQPEALPPLQILVVAEDDAAAHSAEALCLRIAPEGTCALEVGHLEELTSEARFQATAEAAATADLLLFAFSNSCDLPPPVKSWLRCWLSLRDPGRDGALVALMSGGHDGGQSANVRLHLETVATIAGVKFFAGRIGPDGHFVDWSPLPESSAPQPTAPGWDTEAIADQPVPVRRWGINE
jgi:hypothetical protein